MNRADFIPDLDLLAVRRDAAELNSLRLAAFNARTDGKPEEAEEHEADAAAIVRRWSNTRHNVESVAAELERTA